MEHGWETTLRVRESTTGRAMIATGSPTKRAQSRAAEVMLRLLLAFATSAAPARPRSPAWWTPGGVVPLRAR